MASSSSDAVIVDQLEDLLTCSICLETLCEPRTLPCFHTFCKCCLEKFVKRHREVVIAKKIEVFNCPTCRSEFSLKQSEEVEGMTSSHFIRNMLEVMAIQRKAKSSQCSRCEEAAISRCMSCEIFLCEKCFTSHQSWPSLNKNHTVLSINELSEPENQAKIKAKLHCKKHDGKTLKFYCDTCQEPLCRYCLDFNHLRSDHLCYPIEEVAEKEREILGTHCATLEENLKEGNDTLMMISNVTHSLEDNAKKAKNEITQQKQHILKVLAEKLEEKAALKMQEVDRKYNETIKPLTEQKTEVKSYVDKIKGSYNLAKTIFEKGNNEEILSSQKTIQENVEKMKNERPSIMKPVHDGNIQFTGSKINHADVEKLLDKELGEVACHPVAVPCKLSNISTILNGNSEFENQLVNWLDDQFRWRLCYQASKDGWGAQDFHRHCDDKGPTVTLVKVEEYIFGGYSDQNWTGNRWKKSFSSFLFSLRNKDGLLPFKAPVKDNKSDFSIRGNPNDGPCFGGGHDLCICGYPHLNQGSYTFFGDTYKLPEGYVCNNKSKSLLAGSYKFTPTEIEVFY